MPQLYAFVLAAIVVALLAVALYRTSRVKTKPTIWWLAVRSRR